MNTQPNPAFPALLTAVALASGLLAQHSHAAPLEIRYNHLETFDDPVPLAAGQEPDAWYPDRYQPAAFESFELNGGNVLRLAIDPAEGAQNRPPGFSSVFFNTQGRKLDLPEGTDRISARLFFPSSWEGGDTRRRSEIWAAAVDDESKITVYPIIGIANLDGTPVVRYWDGNGGGWVNVPIAPLADTWYRFDMLLAGSEVVYFVDGVEVGRVDSDGSVGLSNAIIQAYNFNDANLDPGEYRSGDPYDAYWDDLSIDFELSEARRKPDLTVGLLRAPATHRGSSVYSRNPNRQQIASNVKRRSQARIFLGLSNAGSGADEIALRMIGGNKRNVLTRVFETGQTDGNVTSLVQRGRYTRSLDAGEQVVYRVVQRLTARGRRAGRSVVNQTVFRSRAGEGTDTVSAQVRFRP